MILIGLMANSFFFLNSITDQVISTLIDFMKGLITAYSIAVVATTGVSTSVALYEMYLFVIYIISLLVQSVIFPAVKILFVLKIVNHISLEEKTFQALRYTGMGRESPVKGTAGRGSGNPDDSGHASAGSRFRKRRYF